MDGGKAIHQFLASVTQDNGHEACHDWVEGQLDRQMDRHPCIPLPASRARSPSPMASPWKALLAACQGGDCIPRVCWTHLPSLQIQAVPARGESLTVWPVHSGAFLRGVPVGACVSAPKDSGLVRRAFSSLESSESSGHTTLIRDSGNQGLCGDNSICHRTEEKCYV